MKSFKERKGELVFEHIDANNGLIVVVDGCSEEEKISVSIKDKYGAYYSQYVPGSEFDQFRKEKSEVIMVEHEEVDEILRRVFALSRKNVLVIKRLKLGDEIRRRQDELERLYNIADGIDEEILGKEEYEKASREHHEESNSSITKLVKRMFNK